MGQSCHASALSTAQLVPPGPAPAGRSRAEPRASDSDEVLDFAAALADVARSWHVEVRVDRVLDAVVRSATIIIPGVRRASVRLLGPERALGTGVHTDELIGAVDSAQYDLGEGPGVDAALRGDASRTGDLAADARWPAFGPLAAERGLRSMLSCPLYVIGASLGALNLASDRVAAFDERAEQLSGLFATHAAIALAGCRRGTAAPGGGVDSPLRGDPDGDGAAARAPRRHPPLVGVLG